MSCINSIKEIGIVGSGTMGQGIAISFAMAGYSVILYDRDKKTLECALENIDSTFLRMHEKGKITSEQILKYKLLIKPVNNIEKLSNVDLVIEAIYENLALKKEVLANLDNICVAKTCLVTNTSYLDVDEIASSTNRPEKVAGMHFFSPAHVMKLVEIVEGKLSSKSFIQQLEQLSIAISKKPVVAKNKHGFIGNRILEKYVFQARQLLLDGASPIQVDQAIEKFGMAMGPFRMYDVVGLDLEWRARAMNIGDQITNKPINSLFAIEDRLCEMGRYGQKSGQGYYKYKDNSRTAIHDPTVETLIEKVICKLDIQRRQVEEKEIIERCIFALINEGAKVLEEGVARNSQDIDTTYIYGYGFPKELGGPMQYADTLGLAVVEQRLNKLAAQHGEFFKPAAIISKLSARNLSFANSSKSN